MDLVIKTASLGYNIFDLNDSFYNDICSVFSYNDSDFSLSERKSLLDLSDENLCMIGCNQSNFDIKTLRSICSCKIGDNMNESIYSSENEINNENDNAFIVLKKNIDISKSSNIKVIKCVKMIFRKNIFSENYGFYIMFFMIFFNIILIIFSPISNVEKNLNEYCNKVLEQMEIIYDKIIIEDKMVLLTDNDNKNLREKNKYNLNNTINNNEIKYLTINTPKMINKKERIINNKKNKKRSLEINNTNSIRNMKTQYLNLIPYNNSDKSNNYLNNKKNNKDLIFAQEDDDIKKKEKKDEEKIIEKLKEKNSSDFYIFYVIKYIPFENRKNFLSEPEIQNLSYKCALKIEINQIIIFHY